MAKLSLEHCKSNAVPIISTKDFLDVYKNYTGTIMSYGMLMYRVKKESIDFVFHNGRYYIAVNKLNLSARWQTPVRKGSKRLYFKKYKSIHDNVKKRKINTVKNNIRLKRIFGR